MPADASASPSTAVLILAEPLPRPASRPPLVVDCSVIAAALFAEREAEQAWQHMAGKTLHAPWLIDIEMASVTLRKSATASSELISAALGHFADLLITRHATPTTAVVGLARRYQITAYDAAYLQLADRLRAPLLTFDRALGEAARQHLASLG